MNLILITFIREDTGIADFEEEIKKVDVSYFAKSLKLASCL